MRKLKLEELGRISIEDFKRQPKAPLTLVLDNIRSGLNVGSAFRTADAFALEQIILCGITAQPPHREILKSAIGATESVGWSYEASVREAVVQLQKQGYMCLGIEQTTKSIALDAFSPVDRPMALIFGNEVTGLSEEVLPLVDACIEVPQFGTKHSLNVSVCLGIVVWHILQQVRILKGGS